MRSWKVSGIVALLVLLPLAGAFARGAGGFSWGEQYFDPSLSNVNLGATFNGAYGYTVTWGGQRYGGFALAAHSDAIVPAFYGGFVGGIAGQEMHTGPFMAAITAWTGFGAITVNPVTQGPGAFALFGELTLEAGLSFRPGITFTGYAGMQVIAQVFPEQQIAQNALYSPVVGMRIAWGS